MPAKILSIVNNKGGVGKTTSTIFMGELLALLGKKVLLVDTDESANLSMILGHLQEDSQNVVNGLEPPEKNNISEVYRYRLRTEEEVKKCIQPVKRGLDLIPSSKRFSMIPDQLLLQSIKQSQNNNIILKRALQSVSGDYDYIIIDTAPRNDIIIINSLTASDYVVIPVRSEGVSFKGFKETITRLADLKEDYDITAEFIGCFQTAAEISTRIYKEYEAEYRSMLGKKALPSIRKDVKVNEALSMAGENLIEYTASSNVLYDYGMLLLAMDILDGSTADLIKKAYNIK